MSNYLNQSNVDEDPTVNEGRSSKERLTNLEGDAVAQRNVLSELVKQNNKYAEYLEAEIIAKKASFDFWQDVKKRLAVAGILGMIGIFFTVLWYAVQQWISTH